MNQNKKSAIAVSVVGCIIAYISFNSIIGIDNAPWFAWLFSDSNSPFNVDNVVGGGLYYNGVNLWQKSKEIEFISLALVPGFVFSKQKLFYAKAAFSLAVLNALVKIAFCFFIVALVGEQANSGMKISMNYFSIIFLMIGMIMLYQSVRNRNRDESISV